MNSCDAEGLLDVVEECLHARASEWVFFRELRVGAGLRRRAGQRLDGFALNCLAHTAMRRVCYEVKVSRADYLCEVKKPMKRRVGLRYSNEFYFVTPAGLLSPAEIPIECGLVEVGEFDEAATTISGQLDAIVHFASCRGTYCRVTVPAPWRDTPGPTWEFAASMIRNHARGFAGRTAAPPKQQKLNLEMAGTGSEAR